MINTAIQQIALHYSLFPLNEVDGRVVFCTINPDDITLRQELEFLLSRENVCAEDRNRTGTNLTVRGILSPLRLPIPPDGGEERQLFILTDN